MRARRQERREERRGGDGGTNRYQMRQKLVSFGDDFYIENSAGQKVFKVDGKMLRVRDTFSFAICKAMSCAKFKRNWHVSRIPWKSKAPMENGSQWSKRL